MGVVLVYGGFLLLLAGTLCLLRPLRILRIRTRRRAFVVAAVGNFLIRAGPAPLLRPEEFIQIDRQAGYAKAALNFRLQDLGGGQTLLTTETRVLATDSYSLWRCTPFWRLIYPGSVLIRHMWLRAIKTRAEGDKAAVTDGG